MIFLSLLAYSSDDMSIETYCFSDEARRTSIEKKVSTFFVPSDKILAEKNCLTVQMRPHRRELLQNFIRSADPDMLVTFSSAEKSQDPCLLKIEKVRLGSARNTNINIGLFPGATQSSVKEEAKDVMQIQTLDKFSFTYRQDVMEGQCKFINSNLYEITISARRDPRPIVPTNLPPGTIVNVVIPPENQKTVSLSTTLQLTRGSRVELGSIIKDLEKENRQLDISSGANTNDAKSGEEEKIYLSFQ